MCSGKLKIMSPAAVIAAGDFSFVGHRERSLGWMSRRSEAISKSRNRTSPPLLLSAFVLGITFPLIAAGWIRRPHRLAVIRIET